MIKSLNQLPNVKVGDTLIIEGITYVITNILQILIPEKDDGTQAMLQFKTFLEEVKDENSN